MTLRDVTVGVTASVTVGVTVSVTVSARVLTEVPSVPSSDAISVVKILRVARVLRPLRAINRAKGLKVGDGTVPEKDMSVLYSVHCQAAVVLRRTMNIAIRK